MTERVARMPGAAPGWVVLALPDDLTDLAALQRFAAALSATTQTITLRRGQLLIADQQRIAHGRSALGDQAHLAAGARRWLVQAKTTCDLAAPAQTARPGTSGRDG